MKNNFVRWLGILVLGALVIGLLVVKGSGDNKSSAQGVATTTPSVEQQPSQSTPLEDTRTASSTTSKLTTSSLSNFTFQYPTSAIAGPSGNDKKVIDGTFQIFEKPDAGVFLVSTTTFNGGVFNPKAKSLDDYAHDYDGGYSGYPAHVVIHSQEKVVINGIPMLRQMYSIQTKNPDGSTALYSDYLGGGGGEHFLRYAFYDQKNFIIISGYNNARDFIDEIARSVKLK